MPGPEDTPTERSSPNPLQSRDEAKAPARFKAQVILAMLVIVGGLIAFQLFSPKSVSNTSVSNASTPSAITPSTPSATDTVSIKTSPVAASSMSAADLLKQASLNMKSLKSYHLDVISSEATRNLAANVDRANNRSMFVIGNNMNSLIYTISVGNSVYLSTSYGATYTNSPLGGGLMDDFTKMWDRFGPQDIDNAKSALIAVTPATEVIIPIQTAEAYNTKHIQGSISDLYNLSANLIGSSDAAQAVGSVNIWVSTDGEPLIVQMKLLVAVGGRDFNETYSLSQFNKDFNIQPPSNVTSP